MHWPLHKRSIFQKPLLVIKNKMKTARCQSYTELVANVNLWGSQGQGPLLDDSHTNLQPLLIVAIYYVSMAQWSLPTYFAGEMSHLFTQALLTHWSNCVSQPRFETLLQIIFALQKSSKVVLNLKIIKNIRKCGTLFHRVSTKFTIPNSWTFPDPVLRQIPSSR